MKNIKEIILGFFTDKYGDGSAKRGVLWSTLLVWFITIFANLFWGRVLEVSLKVQLFSFLTTALVLVFGEQIANWIEKRKADQPKTD